MGFFKHHLDKVHMFRRSWFSWSASAVSQCGLFLHPLQTTQSSQKCSEAATVQPISRRESNIAIVSVRARPPIPAFTPFRKLSAGLRFLIWKFFISEPWAMTVKRWLAHKGLGRHSVRYGYPLFILVHRHLRFCTSVTKYGRKGYVPANFFSPSQSHH